MPGVELHSESTDRRSAALNSALGVGFDAVNAMAETLLLPSLVLAFFVAELTPSYMTIGLVPAVATSLWTLARVPALLLIDPRGKQQPWAFAAALVRAGAIAILALLASRTSPTGLMQSGRPLLITAFLCLIVFSLAGGFGSVPTSALFRASIAPDSWGSFIRWRSIWSAGLTLLGALLIARLLGPGSLPFPGDYGRLFLVATVFLIACAVFTVAIREFAPAAVDAPLLAPARALGKPLLDNRYQRFLIFRILLSSTAAVDPFLFLYAVTRLGVPATSIGAYAVAGVIGWVLTASLWAWLERSSGPRAVLQSAAVLRLIAPAAALALPQIADTPLAQNRFSGVALAPEVFAVAFFAIGAALAAQARGNSSYLSPLAPKPMRTAYAGLTNGVLVFVAFAPVAGGLLIQRAGYEALFIASIVVGLIAVFLGGWLADVSPQLRNADDRPRGAMRMLPILPPTEM